jgi:Leucine-rich repeat (LRR) protein
MSFYRAGDTIGLAPINSLVTWYCHGEDLRKLPPYPLIGLTKISCYDNYLTELPELPVTLEELYCYQNELTELPELPQSLIILSCGTNNLTELPELPQSLIILGCGNNNLTALPELPITVETFDCRCNNIKYLSPNNCQVIKNIENIVIRQKANQTRAEILLTCRIKLNILYNPFSDGFNDSVDFMLSL